MLYGLAAVGLFAAIGNPSGGQGKDPMDFLSKIKDPEVRAGLDAAIQKNMLPAAVEQGYPGQFNITADGGAYGGWATWPGLDSWQMAGAYLLLGKTRMVLDYFDFVRASQRKDGDIPFAIFTGDTRPDGTYLSGLDPKDVFTYKPPKREGLPASSQETRDWIGMFVHWQPKAECLSTLGPVCYILTAAEIYDKTKDKAWLRERLPSIEGAARKLKARTSPNGLVGHSGFYVELPPRYGWDGVAQCYVVHAYREMDRLVGAARDDSSMGLKMQWISWKLEADKLTKAFSKAFWQTDHFAEYVHESRGVVDSHGLSDTNWAAIAFGIATKDQTKKLWPKLLAAKDFWWGGMPTLTVTKPFSYETWEYHEKVPMEVPPLNDVAAMGRTWFLEAEACLRMKDTKRLAETVRRVCQAGLKDGGFWRERYQPQQDGTALPARSEKYCEYPAVLVRVVLGNEKSFAGK